jgi:hypothetical protein
MDMVPTVALVSMMPFPSLANLASFHWDSSPSRRRTRADLGLSGHGAMHADGSRLEPQRFREAAERPAEAEGVRQLPEECSVRGDDPDLAPGRLEVSADRDEDSDACVVYLVEICEVEHGHVAGPSVEERSLVVSHRNGSEVVYSVSVPEVRDLLLAARNILLGIITSRSELEEVLRPAPRRDKSNVRVQGV